MRNQLAPLFFVMSLVPFLSEAQIRQPSHFFSDVILHVDTMHYAWSEHTILVQNKKQLAFPYNEENEIAEVFLHFREASDSNNLKLLPSKDYELLDSLLVLPEYARFKVRFRSLTETNFLKFTFEVSSDTSSYELTEVPLFPYTNTYVAVYPSTDELFIGEEATFELTSNNVENIVFDNRWTEGLPINHRIVKEGKQFLLSVLPVSLGNHRISVPLSVKRPFIVDGNITYELPPLEYTFNVKAGRLAFLQVDRQEVTPPDDKTKAIEIQIDNSRFLSLGKTYRIENQEEPGGALIAELFTKSRLNNNKILCLLRVYAYHRKSDGYLYIKDGDDPRFVTNLDITPKTQIQNIYIQREGKDWQISNTVYPGETVLVKLEGEGIHKANFSFPGADNLLTDSLLRNENTSIYKLKIPVDVSASKIEIYNHRENTGKSLVIKEYQTARDFDYISLDFGIRELKVADISRPIYYEGTITDLVIAFDRGRIDQPGNIHGKQYLKIDVKVSNKQGNLIELYKFESVGLCPAENSPRFVHYNNSDCIAENINLNNYLSRKTYDLDEWSKIEIEFSNLAEKHGGQTFRKRVIIYLKRKHTFDIDVSFPGGLLILKAGAEEFVSFGGVSFAMLAQFSFYQEGRIAKYKPYKLGAGFIAINAFNFAEQANRDVGLVLIGSVYPIASTNRLAFPLYCGFGFLMKEKKLFSLIGPGIRVQF